MMLSIHSNPRFTIENDVLKGTDISFHDDYTNIGEFVLDRLTSNPEFIGLIDAVTGEEYSYRKMRDRTVRCALWMRSQGLLPRDVIAVCSSNRLDYMIPCFAALYLGAIFATWGSSIEAEDVYHHVKVSKPKMVFVDEGSVAVIAEAAKRADLDIKMIVFDRVSGFLYFDGIIAEPEIHEVEKFACTPIESLEETAHIVFSSGSTGPSKAVVLSHGSLTVMMHQADALGVRGNVCLNFSSVDWCCMVESAFMHIFSATSRFITPEFDSSSACVLIETYKASWILLVPAMINELLKSCVTKEYDLSSVTRVVYTGSKLSTRSYDALKKLLPNALLTSGYGMTESGGWFSLQMPKSKPDSCGQIMPGSQLKVVDSHTGKKLGVNQRGQLMLKSAFMMNSYYNNPQATAEAYDEEGWLISGDLGYYDEDGEIFVIDRLKDIIRCDYYDVCPFEIESVIMSHPGVKDVAVVGQPQADEDDLPMAFVVRAQTGHNENGVTESDIVDLVAAELPYSRRLRAGVRFVDHIPRTASNKIARLRLRELARSMASI